MERNPERNPLEHPDEELVLALRELAREEAPLPLGMVSRLEAGVNAARGRSQGISADAATVIASVVFVVASITYMDFFSIGFAVTLAAASGLYGFSLKWILNPTRGTS
ncbi:MAG: hypothetical protein R3E98_03475 [Gemmatimonadota bacterium]|nr:hypothetical protein [Gemmatimonadota bacterium]